METLTAELPFTFPRNFRSNRAASENFLDDYSLRSYHAGRCLYDNGRHQHAINAFTYGLMHDPGELRLYAEKHDMRYEAYDWIGRKLFGLTDASISRILPFILEIEYPRLDILDIPPLEAGICDRDSQGYFQHHTKLYAPYKKQFVSFFQPLSAVKWILQCFVNEIRKQGETLVAIHLRLGDAGGQGRSANLSLYLEWLKALWPTLERPVLFLASDDLPATRRAFEEFNPITSEHPHFPFPGAGFYPDFYILTQADYIGAGNSTFSFAASMLNEEARVIVRPNHENTMLVRYDPWSAKPTA